MLYCSRLLCQMSADCEMVTQDVGWFDSRFESAVNLMNYWRLCRSLKSVLSSRFYYKYYSGGLRLQGVLVRNSI